MTSELLAPPRLAAPSAPRPGRGAALRTRAAVLRVATLAVVVVAWQLIATVGPLAGSDYIAAPSRTLSHGLPFVLQHDTLLALWVTTQRFLTAFVLAAAVGVGVGLLLGRAGRQTFVVAQDVTVVLYTLPLVPFYPLFVLWLGLGPRSEIAFGAVHGIVPVVLLMMGAAARVDPELLAASKALGAGPAQRVRKVVLPAVVPDIVGALRIGAALSLLGVLLGELMISVDGIGPVIAQLIANLRPAELDAVILAVCLGAVVVNSALSAGERRLSRWR